MSEHTSCRWTLNTGLVTGDTMPELTPEEQRDLNRKIQQDFHPSEAEQPPLPVGVNDARRRLEEERRTFVDAAYHAGLRTR